MASTDHPHCLYSYWNVFIACEDDRIKNISSQAHSKAADLRLLTFRTFKGKWEKTPLGTINYNNIFLRSLNISYHSNPFIVRHVGKYRSQLGQTPAELSFIIYQPPNVPW